MDTESDPEPDMQDELADELYASMVEYYFDPDDMYGSYKY